MSTTVIKTVSVGTTSPVVIRRYGDGIVSFQPDGGLEKRINPGESKPEWPAGLVDAIEAALEADE